MFLFIRNPNCRWAALLLMLFIMLPVHSQENDVVDKTRKKPAMLPGSLQNTRGYSRFSKGASPLQQQGLEQYFRSATLDGNLVTGSITNSGIISHSNLSIPPISWPKGPQQVSYIFASIFYFAAEVIDANGDTIAIVSDHYRFGETAPDGTHGYYFMPLPKYYNLDQPDAQSAPLIGGISEDVGLDGLPRTNDTGENDGILQPIEDFNKNGILDLSMQNKVGWFAASHRKETWPTYWPVGSYPGDDRQPGEEREGVRAGRWNGEFGSYVRADQEGYYLMDDRENDEFAYYPFNDIRPWPEGRRGLGVAVEARAYQWNARLAEDILINIYDITLQEGAKDLNKCVVGMLVDPDMGGFHLQDDADYRTLEDITYTWNKTGRTLDRGLPIGYFGFAFLESPGLSFDGEDNDEDGMIDESQSNGLDDDGDWRPWEDLDGNGVYDSEDLNYNGILDPGEDLNGNGELDFEPIHDDTGADGLRPDDFEYAGPDLGEANGVPDLGEPNFEFTDNDESDQVGLTSWYLRQGTGGMGNDQEYWNLALQPDSFGAAQNVTDIAFIYGSGFVQFTQQDRTHRYAIALAFGNNFDDILRNKKTIQVIYDNDYNFAKPPLQPTLTAIAGDRKVYLKWDNISERSTDPIYGHDFEAYYIYKSTDPTFNEIKTITDGFGNPLLFKPLAIFDIANGLTGLHPVRLGSEIGGGSDLGVTYNMGTDSGLRHYFIDEDLVNGRTYYYAIGAVDRGHHPDFYPFISDKPNLNPISPTECPVNIQIDPLGRPIAFDRNTARVIPTEMSAGWMEPRLSDEGFEHLSGRGTGHIGFMVYNPLTVKTGHRYRVTFDDNGQYEPLGGLYTGKLNHMSIYSLTDDILLGSFPDPKNFDMDEKYIIDGIRFFLFNDSTRYDTLASQWTTGNSNMIVKDNLDSDTTSVKRDYEIRITEPALGDTSHNNRVMNFQLWDITDPAAPFKQKFFIVDTPPAVGILDQGDKLAFLGEQNDPVWRFDIVYPDSQDIVEPQPGDLYKIVSRKSFDRNDVIEFTVVGNSIDDNMAKNELDNIYVVPDPYIAVNRLERKVFNPEEGRGERRIDFVNLPKECSISIFTVSGKFVQKIVHVASEANRRASWDLRTKDGLEIAHGVYFYAVEAPGIGVKTGKFAVIK